MKTQKLDPWIEGYLSYLKDVRRVAHRSIADARCSLKKAIRENEKIRGDQQPLWKLTFEDFLKWINYEREQERSIASLAKDISHIRGLLNYAWRSGRCDRNVLDGLNLQDSIQTVPPRVLTLDEARRLLEVCECKNKLQRRDRMIILLLYGCGLRTNELRMLDLGDIDLERQELFVKHGKGDRQRRIPVATVVWTELLAYLRERNGKRGPLFRTYAKGVRIRTLEIGTIVKEAAQRAQLPGLITPKTLRHTFATHLMDRGVDISVVSSLMGHRGVAETGVYLHVLPGKPQHAVAQLSNQLGEVK